MGVRKVVTNQAAFVDRDGIINHLVWNPTTREYESPHAPDDVKFIEGVEDALRRLGERRELFLISNQPSYAKGKTSLENIKAIHVLVDEFLKRNGIFFRDYFYCYHHPQGVVPAFSGICACRKPEPFFIVQACKKYELDAPRCWMIGDQDIDVECGRNAGVLTGLILYEYSNLKRGKSRPDVTGKTLADVVDFILNR
jgi:D-glycero-D-manno-heptose 1,7-bisphosphate phosphatase